jgi:hypothetical protein
VSQELAAVFLSPGFSLHDNAIFSFLFWKNKGKFKNFAFYGEMLMLKQHI